MIRLFIYKLLFIESELNIGLESGELYCICST